MLPAVYIPESTINSSPTLFVIENENFDGEFQHVLNQMQDNTINDSYEHLSPALVWFNTLSNVQSTSENTMDVYMDNSNGESSMSSAAVHHLEASFDHSTIIPHMTNKFTLYSTIEHHPSVQIAFINNLKAAGATMWSNIILDIMVDPGWALDHVTVTVQISKGVTFSKDNFEEITVNTDVNVISKITLSKIIVTPQLCLVTTTYQARAWSNAQWLVYSTFEHVGIIPLPEEMLTNFKEQLAKALVWDNSRSYNIFHWVPGHAPLAEDEIVMALHDCLSVGRRFPLPSTKHKEVVTITNMNVIIVLSQVVNSDVLCNSVLSKAYICAVPLSSITSANHHQIPLAWKIKDIVFLMLLFLSYFQKKYPPFWVDICPAYPHC
ncbi:hypothetical protein BDN67DRAFT_984969 [Paxillus ammoniavirescens]|nr:hypothetical protein BDN67DRAFT_984969 [Paxillus ammoniavirescens]